MPAQLVMDFQDSEALRIRRCYNPSCNTMFTICANCDRGQRYCSDVCRSRMRRQQRAAAGCRYQSSPAGRLAHARRQQTYRQRHKPAEVTHQGPVMIVTPRLHQPASLCRCLVCGQESRWINPFAGCGLPRVRRRRMKCRSSSAGVQISTFSRDR